MTNDYYAHRHSAPCLLVREARTLKDKRQVLQSIKDRLRNQFNVSVAEVDYLDDRRLAELGVAMVGPDAQSVKACWATLSSACAAIRSRSSCNTS